jgi:predicted nucleic acid-binding protein
MTYLLDACALIAYIKEERGKGFEAVEALFNRAWVGSDTLCISAVNLVEVYYDFIRAEGMEAADEVMREVARLPVTVIETIDGEMRRAAARFKVRYSMSFADTFVCATAKSLGAVIVTKDGEIRKLEKAEGLSVLWIKP